MSYVYLYSLVLVIAFLVLIFACIKLIEMVNSPSPSYTSPTTPPTTIMSQEDFISADDQFLIQVVGQNNTFLSIELDMDNRNRVNKTINTGTPFTILQITDKDTPVFLFKYFNVPYNAVAYVSVYNNTSATVYNYAHRLESAFNQVPQREFQFLDKNENLVSKPQYNTEYRIKSYFYSNSNNRNILTILPNYPDDTMRLMYINNSKAYITVSPPDGINPLYAYNADNSYPILYQDPLLQNVLICTPPTVSRTNLTYITLNFQSEIIDAGAVDNTDQLYIDYINTQYARCSTTFKFIKPV